jgi:hypothetical protein
MEEEEEEMRRRKMKIMEVEKDNGRESSRVRQERNRFHCTVRMPDPGVRVSY